MKCFQIKFQIKKDAIPLSNMFVFNVYSVIIIYDILLYNNNNCCCCCCCFKRQFENIIIIFKRNILIGVTTSRLIIRSIF